MSFQPPSWAGGLVGRAEAGLLLMGSAGQGNGSPSAAPPVSGDPDSISSNHQHCHLPVVIKWYLNRIQKSHCKQPMWQGAGAGQRNCRGLRGGRVPLGAPDTLGPQA